MTLTLDIHIPSCLHLPTFRSKAAIVSEKSTVFSFSIEKPKVPNLNYDGQESPMLHTKFQGNRPVGSGEEDF